MADTYKYIGPVYDFLSSVYSAKSIDRCRTANLNANTIQPGDRVLFAGVGYGRDAMHAARLGARVTVVDLSETMLENFERILEKEDATDLSIRRVHADIFQFEEFEQYDMVVANFFLNVFDEPTMSRLLGHLVRMGRPGARIVVGDFCYPQGNFLARNFQKLYWYLAAFTFWLLANNALHQIYNYPEYLRKLGVSVQDKKRFKLFRMNCYWSILGQKSA